MAALLPVVSVVVEASPHSWFGLLHLPTMCQVAQEEITAETLVAKALWIL